MGARFLPLIRRRLLDICSTILFHRWLVYKDIDYYGSAWLYVDQTQNLHDYLGNTMDNAITSIRRVGASNNPFTSSSITFFEYYFTRGRSLYINESTSYVGDSFNNEASSIITIGSQSWTVYE